MGSADRTLPHHDNVYVLGKAVFTTYLFAFEATAALLVIAVVGAVVLARRPKMEAQAAEEEEPAPADGGLPPASGEPHDTPGARLEEEVVR